MVTVNFYGVERSRQGIAAIQLRQTPGGEGVYRNCRFGFGNPNADWQVVGTWDLNDFLNDAQFRIPGKKAIYLQQEPPEVCWHPPDRLREFTAILTPSVLDVDGPKQFIAPPLLGWMYGLRIELQPGLGHWFDPQGIVPFDHLLTAQPPAKTRLCSMIVSQKTFTPGHRKRVEFLTRLRDHCKNRIDFFGFGYNPILDKKEAIDPYLFSIAVENSVHRNYWTEKIADIYLGHAMPIYHGAPNIDDFFASASLQRIDIEQTDATIAAIETLLDHPERHNPQLLAQERSNLLEKYNFFNYIALAIENTIHPPRP